MIRNLVLKLPSLKSTSDYAFSSSLRTRNFRSLSPVQRVRTSVGTERSVSCSRVESGHIVNVSRTPQARALCFSKEYYAQTPDDFKKIQWRNVPERKKEETVERKQEIKKRAEAIQFETLEQYELEAAKPRPPRSRDVIEAFSSPKRTDNGFFHLQPSQIKPYGSQDNMYSPSLIRPTNLLKYPRKFKRKDMQDHERTSNNAMDASGFRTYCTSEVTRELSTSQNHVEKEIHNSNSREKNIYNPQKNTNNLKFLTISKPATVANFNALKRVSQSYKETWAAPKERITFSPPVFVSRNKIEDIPLKLSTAEMRQKRLERENQNSDRYYKPSYSDLVKLRLKQHKEEKLSTSSHLNLANTDTKSCLAYMVKHTPKTSQILQVVKAHSYRSLTTRSKSNLLSKEPVSINQNLVPNSTLLTTQNVDESQEQRNYSMSKSKDKKLNNRKANKLVNYNASCEDVCTPLKKAVYKSNRKEIPMEPKSCESSKVSNKVFLRSKVKLEVPPCTPKPDFIDCKKVEPCPPRADECLEINAKTLPKLPTGKCPCIDPHVPSKAPKLEKLNFKFEDPPKLVCHVPPCQIPRADESNPYKFKPLKPYVPGECDCVPPPPMLDVKLKRLPRCEPEEVCRPVRVCPVIEKCPPRADECLKIEPKTLPPIEPPPCPCLDPPIPNIAPPIKRLDLKVPEPPRVCLKSPPCKERERADDSLKLKMKKLPKFVPGDCPCEDRPMIDWNPKRLICEDEPTDCVVPDPCKTFPRADWGCWEYQDEICEMVDEKCIEKVVKCPAPSPPKPHRCDKRNVCKDNSPGLQEIRDIPKRRYSNSSTSLKLYQQVKSQNIVEGDEYIKTTAKLYKPPEIKQPKMKAQKSETSQISSILTSKKLQSNSTIGLVKMLNYLDPAKHDMGDHLLFKPKQDEKVNYDKIIEKIASSTVVIPRTKQKLKAGSLAPALKRSKSSTIKVTSRAISTNKTILKDEKDMQHDKECKGKKICKNIRPSVKALMCQKKCANVPSICEKPSREHRPCRFDRIPVCCEKEEPPYSAYTDNLEKTIKPYTKTPQWTCNRMKYGFHPNFKKEHEPLKESKKKDTKSFSTSMAGSGLYANSSHIVDCPATSRLTNSLITRKMSNKTPKLIPKEPTKALLKKSASNNVIFTQSRTLSSKIFLIRPPVPAKPKSNKKCEKKVECIKKISCIPNEEYNVRVGCKKEFINEDCKRKPPPFPAFSDCLDEEMEDILTECPLDKEKYLRMQPRFSGAPKKAYTLKPPPPIQGKIDLLKEQDCLREKLCIANEGLTQTCSDFGKPVPLMKTKKLIKEKNRDCQRMEELKKLGRWPPFSSRQNRRICTSTYRNLSTMSLNSISEISKESTNASEVKRLYIRNYHALVKSTTDKAVLADNEAKLKELTKKIFPDMDESSKLLKLRRAKNLKNYGLPNIRSNVAKRAIRFYTTYKTKHKSFLRWLPKGCTFKTYLARRRVSNGAKFLRFRVVNLRGTRSLKSGRPNNAKGGRCEGEANKKWKQKFTLNNGSLRGPKNSGYRKSSGKYGHKPFSPFPAFSESQKFSRPSDIKNLQPNHNIFTDNGIHIREYPEQEKIDRAMGFEYYKCKHGIQREGTTLDCESLGFCTGRKVCDDSCTSKTKCNNSRSVVELLIQEHKKQKQGTISCCQESQDKGTPCSCKGSSKSGDDDECAEDRKKLENICMEHCLKSIPCHLPEEEKYCICREECKKVFRKSKERCLEVERVECYKEKEKQNASCDCNVPKNQDTDLELKKLADCMKSKKNKSSKQVKFDCYSKPSTSKAVICPPAPCAPKRSKSFTQLENLWQMIVNYFKARPNCPEPDDWKKKALKEKAEKAAKAAGLVALNPKCLPPDILRAAKVSTNDCKVCPNKDPCEKKDCDCENKSTSSGQSKRNFSTVIQSTRNYSNSMSSQNLEEINRLLDESESMERKLRYRNSNPNFKREFDIFSQRKDTDTSEAIKMSLDKALCKYVDIGELFFKDSPYSRTYFGYSDIIPSRENILERAWRISIESCNKYNYPRNCNFFNEILNKIEKTTQNVEDLEKLKTENVLKELENILKKKKSDKNKK